MRFCLRPPLCLLVALIGLAPGAGAWADASAHAVPRDPASCPQLEYTNELPPVADDPSLVLDADNVAATPNGLSHLTGAVHLTKDGRAFAAEAVDYDSTTDRIAINTESLFRDPRLVIKSGHADFDLAANTGEFFDTHFTLISANGRGIADRIFVTADHTAELDHVTYTSCAIGSNAWLMSAGRLNLDNNTGVGTAHDTLLRFQNVPFLYLPYFSYPIDDQRHSGFIAPIFGESNNRGFDLRVPIYLNLAPNYDATLTPRYMSRRGEQLGVDFRYLEAHSEGTLHGEYLPYDSETHRERSYIDFSHEGLLTPHLALEGHYGRVSDRDYFSDFGGHIDLSSINFLARGATLTYQAPASYTVEALVQNYQAISQAITADDNPYTRLPQIRVDAITKHSFLDTHAGIDGEFTKFVRSGNSVEGLRAIAEPYLRWDQDRNAWFASAQGDLNYTAYSLTTPAVGQPTQPRRTIPSLSLDGGLRFERDTGGLLQILEPHLQYLLVPYRNQDLLPLFDSGQPDFDFPQLFARNRYSGSDRIADANQLTTALTTRFIDPNSGLVRLTASIGEVYAFTGPRVALPGIALPSPGASDLVAEATYQINRRWETDATAQIGPQFDSVTRRSIALRYREPDAGLQGQRFDIEYRYRKGLLEQTDTSFSTPIFGDWRVASRLRYSFSQNKALESFLGLEYQTCCWAMRGTYRRYLSSSDGAFSNGVYFQLEFKGLTRIGNGFDTLLPALDPDASIVGSKASKVIP